MVYNLVGGIEPHKFHTCIHRTLRSFKNKMSVMNFIYFIFIAQNFLLLNPWNWLTEPLEFDRTQVKNHCLKESIHTKSGGQFLTLWRLNTMRLPVGIHFSKVENFSSSSTHWKYYKVMNNIYSNVRLIKCMIKYNQ